MNWIRRCALAALVSGGLAGAAATLPAQAADAPAKLSQPEAELLAAESQRFKAMIERDAATLDRLLADELVYVHSSSTRQTKTEHLGDVKAGRAKYFKIDVKEQAPYVYGDVGIIQGVATFIAGSPTETPFTLRYTDAYVKRDGRWQMVAFHCTRIPAAGSGPPPQPPRAP